MRWLCSAGRSILLLKINGFAGFLRSVFGKVFGPQKSFASFLAAALFIT